MMGDRRVLSWEEVEKHKDVTDRWIVIDGKVYDITQWQKQHPGGRKVLGHFAAQDATEPVLAFHKDEKQIAKYLKRFYIGDLLESIDGKMDLSLQKRKAYTEDFEELRQKVISVGLLKSNVFFFMGMLMQILIFEALAYLNLFYFGVSWWRIIVSIALYTIAQAQAGWLQHDFGHLSVFTSTRWNHFFHEVTLGLLKGASCHWWNHMHSQHHSKPNIIDKDPDIRLEPLFVIGNEQPRRAAKDDSRWPIHMPYQYQNLYFYFIAPPLLFPVYFQTMSFRYIFLRRCYEDFFWVMLFFIKAFLLYTPLLGIRGTILYLFVVRVCESHWFTWVSQSNHIPMEIYYDRAEAWLPMQARATCNVMHSLFNDWFTGHLNFQLEHHLFPTMPRHNFIQVQPYVKELCQRHGIVYQEKELGVAFADIIRALKSGADLWKNLTIKKKSQ